MREIIIQRLIKSRERILAGGYYGNKRKLSTDWLHILFIIYGWRNQGRKSTKDDANSWMNTKSTLLTTYTIADMGDAEKEFAMVMHKVTKFEFLPLFLQMPWEGKGQFICRCCCNRNPREGYDGFEWLIE